MSTKTVDDILNQSWVLGALPKGLTAGNDSSGATTSWFGRQVRRRKAGPNSKQFWKRPKNDQIEKP